MLAVLSAALGTAASALPEDWIERRLGFSPDGGNGLLEFLWVAAPFVVAALLTLSLVRDYRRSVAKL
jgi:hypothetical protein